MGKPEDEKPSKEVKPRQYSLRALPTGKYTFLEHDPNNPDHHRLVPPDLSKADARKKAVEQFKWSDAQFDEQHELAHADLKRRQSS